MVFHWNPSESQSLQVSWILLIVLADFNYAVVWFVSSRLLISKSSSACTNPWMTVPSAPVTIGIAVTFKLYSFFSSLPGFRYLSLSAGSFLLTISILVVWSRLDDPFLLLLLLFTPLEFFTSVLADGFSLEFEWQQVSSSLQDSSKYSGRPQQCCRLHSLYPSANFQVLQAL